MEAYWRFVDDVSRGGSLIQDYTEWLSKQETVFRKEKLSDLMLWFPDDKCWFEFRVSEPSTGKTTKKRVEKEELISSIDAEIPAFDFYIDLFSDEEVQESISGRNLDCYEHLRYVKKLVGFRARFNECLQKILSYTMDQNDCLLADEILAVIEHNDIFDALHTPKTRNILNAFNVWCKIYNTGSQADGQHQPADALDKIETASAHLLSLINDVLDISRINSGRMQIAKAPFSLSDLLHDILTIARPQMEQKKHAFVF